MTLLASREPLRESLQSCALHVLTRRSTSLMAGSWWRWMNSAFKAVSCRNCLHVSRYLYYHDTGLDACFRFKRRDISSYKRDPELGPGFAYLVAWEAYENYLRSCAKQNEVTRFIC